MYTLQLSTVSSTLLIILAVLLSVFFLLSGIAVFLLIRILQSVRHMADKAEQVVDTVEAAAENLRSASGKLTFLKLIKNIVDISQHKHKK